MRTKNRRSEQNVKTNAITKYEKPVCTGPEPSHIVMMLATVASKPPKPWKMSQNISASLSNTKKTCSAMTTELDNMIMSTLSMLFLLPAQKVLCARVIEA